MSWLTIVSPFLAAALASYLTYLFTTRTRRQEFVSGQTLDAFKAIHRVLIDIRKGCQLRLAEHRQGEFEPGVWGEAPYQSPLEQLDVPAQTEFAGQDTGVGFCTNDTDPEPTPAGP